MSNEKTCTIPWHDGTDREVEVGTACETKSGLIRYASEGGFQTHRGEGKDIWPWRGRKIVRILTEAPEPPVKVNVPTGLGAIVSSQFNPRRPAFVLGQRGWSVIRVGVWFEASSIAYALRNGAVVLFEGIDEDTP